VEARKADRTLELQTECWGNGSFGKQCLAEVIAGEKTLVEAIVKGESAGVIKATRGKTKWQGDGTGNSPVYIKFSYNPEIFLSLQ